MGTLSRGYLGYILLGRQPGETESTTLNIAVSVIFAKFSHDEERRAPPPPPRPQ